LNHEGIIPVQNPYNFLIKKLSVNKAAIIGIGIAIIVAAIGVYAVTSTQDGSSADETAIGIGDTAGVKIGEGPEEVPTEEAEIGLKDEAEVTIDEPEDEPPDEVEIFVKEKLGVGDKQP